MIKKIINDFLEKQGYNPITKKETRKNSHYHLPNWEYQKKIILPHIKPSDIVIDFGSGHNPSPRATILSDYFPDDTLHRGSSLIEDRPVIVCSLERLPFKGKSIDFAICSHVFEHLDYPLLAANELGRVAKAGYIETPAYGRDILVGTGNMHQWQVVSHDGELHFFQYTKRQHEGHTMAPIMKYWGQSEYHPWQDFFWERQDLFNAFQLWEGCPVIIEHRINETQQMANSKKSISKNDLPNKKPSLNNYEIGLLEKVLSVPDTKEDLFFTGDAFVNEKGTVSYFVVGKRVYVEMAEAI